MREGPEYYPDNVDFIIMIMGHIERFLSMGVIGSNFYCSKLSL